MFVRNTDLRVCVIFVVAMYLGFVLASIYNNNSLAVASSKIQDVLSYDSMIGAEYFAHVANSLDIVTDKVSDHDYQIMYGQYLLPYYREHRNMKLLEIGLGCNMKYGPGASVSIWKKLFPEADLWEAEYDVECVKKAKEHGMLEGFHTLTGDQGDVKVLDKWIEASGGNFDVIIDDGGHQNCQIWTSFVKLWPTVKSGGLYFMEDLHVAQVPHYGQFSSPICEMGTFVPEKMKSYLDDLVYDDTTDVKFIFCQKHACVLGKK